MLNGKKVLAVTLARGGSKGVPRKNIRILNGQPLIKYTIDEALKSSLIDEYIISTDCDLIAEIASECGAKVPFTRPAEFATDSATSASALIHAVNYMTERGKNFDYVVELMATNPLKTVDDIDNCINLAITGNHDACVAVHQIFDQHPSRVKKIINGVLEDFYPEIPESRRQDLTPNAYIRSGSIYVTKTSFLLSKRARYGTNLTQAYVLDPEKVVNIDSEDDFYLAEQKMTNLKNRE